MEGTIKKINEDNISEVTIQVDIKNNIIRIFSGDRDDSLNYIVEWERYINESITLVPEGFSISGVQIINY